jgi:hypothetical protein
MTAWRPAMCVAVVLLTGAVPVPALAEAFCVTVQGLPDQCIYADAAECQRRAFQLGGVCTANATTIVTPPGPGKFCLAEGGRAVACVYADRNTCIADAQRRHTACIPATAPPEGGVDPFAVRRPY